MNIVKQAVEGATSLAKPINDAQETGWEGKGETEVDGHQDLVMKRMTHEPLLHANRRIRLVDKQDGHAEEASAQDENAAREEATAKMRGYYAEKQKAEGGEKAPADQSQPKQN